MKFVNLFIISICMLGAGFAQQDFDFQAYQQYLQANQDMTFEELTSENALNNTYYKNLGKEQPITSASFLDSAILKYNLTEDELALLEENHFVVTERLSFDAVGFALHHVYNNDLPVFVSTDAILHALHSSYDRILMDLEIKLLKPTLATLLNDLHNQIPTLAARYQNDASLENALADVDLYVTMALSLLNEEKVGTKTGIVTNFDDVWSAIEAEQAVVLPLFAERGRNLDFSQFTVRGHYTKQYWENGQTLTLGSYFQAMMWLGRMEIWLTPPPVNPFEEPWSWQEIQRMAQMSLMMNELMDLANGWPLAQELDDIITFFVGESDNLTPVQLAEVMSDNNITVASIADSAGLAGLQNILMSSDEYQQKILSAMIMMDPYSAEPGVLPVAYKLMGQRFIIDSYVLGNVVYDRIVYNGAKVWRPMPDPMDAMFVLGNDNTLPLLQEELDQYSYSQNLAGLRYLVDSYDQEFWGMSLYNSWLSAIRTLNPVYDLSEYPLFMQSAAWQQEKLNTQLASWAQLRHDNLLYGKQSYTGMTGCSYPHSFVEPYPAFYAAIQEFADKCITFFSAYPTDDYIMQGIKTYYERLSSTTATLEALAVKELDHEAFSEQDTTFLKSMLFVNGGSGEPPFSGWYADLYYDREDPSMVDHVIADVHTQPTDQSGNLVGHVLHVGVGKFNLGFYMAPAPSDDYKPMIFVGPVMSYYEKITTDFKRMTDDEWKDEIEHNVLPSRPDWVNNYLADQYGNKRSAGRELPYQLLTGINGDGPAAPFEFALSDNYPNPFNPSTTIHYVLPSAQQVTLTVYDITGRQVAELVNSSQNAGTHQVTWNAGHLASGVYFYSIQAGPFHQIKKMTLIK